LEELADFSFMGKLKKRKILEFFPGMRLEKDHPLKKTRRWTNKKVQVFVHIFTPT
jgi:hypothetical protein